MCSVPVLLLSNHRACRAMELNYKVTQRQSIMMNSTPTPSPASSLQSLYSASLKTVAGIFWKFYNWNPSQKDWTLNLGFSSLVPVVPDNFLVKVTTGIFSQVSLGNCSWNTTPGNEFFHGYFKSFLCYKRRRPKAKAPCISLPISHIPDRGAGRHRGQKTKYWNYFVAVDIRDFTTYFPPAQFKKTKKK